MNYWNIKLRLTSKIPFPSPFSAQQFHSKRSLLKQPGVIIPYWRASLWTGHWISLVRTQFFNPQEESLTGAQPLMASLSVCRILSMWWRRRRCWCVRLWWRGCADFESFHQGVGDWNRSRVDRQESGEEEEKCLGCESGVHVGLSWQTMGKVFRRNGYQMI